MEIYTPILKQLMIVKDPTRSNSEKKFSVVKSTFGSSETLGTPMTTSCWLGGAGMCLHLAEALLLVCSRLVLERRRALKVAAGKLQQNKMTQTNLTPDRPKFSTVYFFCPWQAYALFKYIGGQPCVYPNTRTSFLFFLAQNKQREVRKRITEKNHQIRWMNIYEQFKQNKITQ